MKIISDTAGVVLQVPVKVGDVVKSGQVLIVIESVKMEIPIESDKAGKISEVLVKEGDLINEDQPIVILEE